jgi:hypothetical protein
VLSGSGMLLQVTFGEIRMHTLNRQNTSKYFDEIMCGHVRQAVACAEHEL